MVGKEGGGGCRWRETRRARGIKGREAETRPGQNSGATGDVDGAEDKGNNAAAGSCLLPVGFWATSGSIAGHTLLTHVMSH